MSLVLAGLPREFCWLKMNPYGYRPLYAVVYCRQAVQRVWRVAWQEVVVASPRALMTAGSSTPSKTAIIATTIRTSRSVIPALRCRCVFPMKGLPIPVGL